jgi:hypothetical protein
LSTSSFSPESDETAMGTLIARSERRVAVTTMPPPVLASLAASVAGASAWAAASSAKAGTETADMMAMAETVIGQRRFVNFTDPLKVLVVSWKGALIETMLCCSKYKIHNKVRQKFAHPTLPDSRYPAHLHRNRFIPAQPCVKLSKSPLF